jgi:hypothetical protein
MRTKRPIGVLLAILVVGGLSACDDGSDLLGPEPGQVELDLQVDEDVVDATLADVEASLDAVTDVGVASDLGAPALFSTADPELVEQARELVLQAREKFGEARQAWLRGDTELAAELALQARLLVAEALVLCFGDAAYDQMLQRVEQVISWLEERVDGERAELLARIIELREEAEALRDEDLTAATERLVLALQIAHRERIRQRNQEMAQHARLSVFMARSAVGLATDVAGDDANDEQVHALRHARHLLSDAEAALAAGRLELAHLLAREAVGVSLVAVMLEPGVDADRLAGMIELSERAIAAADEALAGRDTNSFAVRLLEHAKNLQARALEIADSSPRRAIYVLWHASVTAYGVIELAS